MIRGQPERLNRKDLALAGAAVGLALVLLLANLGNQYLWQDEAETALITKTVLAHGIPLGYDGKNYFSQKGTVRLGSSDVWRFLPWLQFYVTAPFFALFGPGTLTARLPFALFGAGTVALCYFFAKSLWGSRRAGLIAALLLTTNVPFLILSRQCRYYSAAMFLTVATLYAYQSFLADKQRAGVWFAVSAVLLFHAQPTQCAAALAAVFVHAMFFHRKKLKSLSKTMAVVVALCLPWAIWLSASLRAENITAPLHVMMLTFASEYANLLRKHVVHPIAIAILVAAWIGIWVRRRYPWVFDADVWTKVVLLLLFAGCSIAVSSVVAPAPFFRYIAPVIPIWFVLVALFVESAFKAHVALGALAVLAMAVPVAQGQMKDYLYEITHDYDGPTEGIVKYLNKHARPGDVVAITYGDLTVKFYTNLRVVGGLTGEDLTQARTADWVIVRKWFVSEWDLAVREFLFDQVPLENYDAIRIPYPDTVYENREEPDLHLFRTDTMEDGVLIFHKSGG